MAWLTSLMRLIAFGAALLVFKLAEVVQRGGDLAGKRLDEFGVFFGERYSSSVLSRLISPINSP